ncbi:M81 family metallopeptidase [Thermodesulfobacteriota bacterium]
MKWVIGAFSHETNNFSVVSTDLNAFRAQAFKTGDEVIRWARGTKTPVGGFIDVIEERGDRIIPTVAAAATPSGLVTQGAYETVTAKILDGVSRNRDADGILLALHGAMMAEGIDDGEGHLLEKIREIYNSDPIVVVLDLHSHVTHKMLTHATMLIGYHTYPHTDTYERGVEAARFIHRIAEGKISPVYAVDQPLILPPCSTCNTQFGLYQSLWQKALRPDRPSKILSTSLFAGFPHADQPDAGFTVLCYAVDAATAKNETDHLAKILKKRRDEFLYTPTPVPEAVERAMASTKKPVVISDMSDNPGGGSANDSVEILKELLQRGERDAAVASIYDPETVEAAKDAGVGNHLDICLGAKTDNLHGTPLEAEAAVENLVDGRFHYKGPMTHGMLGNMGDTAVLNISGIRVIVASERIQARDPEMFRVCGIEPGTTGILVLKSAVHFRAAFENIAKEIIVADGPGLTANDLTLFPYQRIRRPMFPINYNFSCHKFKSK